MEAHENEQYDSFPLSSVHEAMHETIISHEEICEPVVDCVLQDDLTDVSVNDVTPGISESQVSVEILADNSDDEDSSEVYPIYIKQEDQQQYTSGDDESMAVEALRQLGGMYPCFNDKKIRCANCANLFTHSEMVKHHPTCAAVRMSCTTCGEKFERRIDLNNHMVCHQVDRPHACRTCGNLFRSRANLQAHMAQVHQTERPHKCNICGADFQRPSSLSNHMKIHTYVAGRAIMQSQNSSAGQNVESFRKWPENNVPEQQTAAISSSSVQSLQNYDVSQVHWSVPGYNFQNDQANVSAIANQEKMDTLQEFAVMPNGEVAQFEYAQQSTMSSQINQQYNMHMNSFNNQDSMVKVETLYANQPRRNYIEVEINDANNKSHTCSHCGVSFARASALASHEKIHTCKNWSMPIECEYCDKQFQDGNHLATHQTTCAKKMIQNNIEQGVPNSKWGKHACSECGKKFTTKQKMFRHQWIHRKKTHSCEVCGSQFEKQNELDEHRLSAHPGDSPFTCGECGKSFVSRQGLWEHGRTHAGSPAHFHCDTCSKTFSSRQGYLIHHRTHTGERPYGCKFCWKAFRDGGTLRKHERIHTGERPHVCPLCSRAFNQKVVLREHVRWVHAAGKNETEVTGPPFPCPLCGALNQDRDELCAHIVKHSDQMIAEAKAKTNNNAPKQKAAKKKTRTMSSNSQVKQHTGNSGLISRSEQNEALLSITDATAEGSEDAQMMTSDKLNDPVHIDAAGKCNETMRLGVEMNRNELRSVVQSKRNESVQVSQSDRDHRETLGLCSVEKQGNTACIISSDQESEALRQNEVNTIHLISSSKSSETLHLITTGKQNNTLHLISKQNESLPVLALPNPENHENFSSQITQMNNSDLPMDMVTPHSTRQSSEVDKTEVEESLMDDGMIEPTVIEVEYHQTESDDCEESVCEICGEDFNDKLSLMEHVKVHI